MSDLQVAEKQTSIMERGTMSAASVLAHVAKVQGLMKDLLHEGEHYGKIPGTDKPTLLKAGAEKLSFTFRLLPKFRTTVRELQNGHREVEMVCELWHESGVFAGVGVGSCSTMESKYRYRNIADFEDTGEPIPADSKEHKAEYRKQGFGMKKIAGQWAWVKYQDAEKQENPDIADVYNTVLKMAKKRALVDATITACAASDIFTQDIEEGHEEEMKNVTPRESVDPLIEARAAVQMAFRAARDSGLFTPDEIEAMKGEGTKHKDDLPSLKHLAEVWAKALADRGGKIDNSKVPFGDENAS